jgi:hypothetical protein
MGENPFGAPGKSGRAVFAFEWPRASVPELSKEMQAVF